jgi:hypothetical protein
MLSLVVYAVLRVGQIQGSIVVPPAPMPPQPAPVLVPVPNQAPTVAPLPPGQLVAPLPPLAGSGPIVSYQVPAVPVVPMVRVLSYSDMLDAFRTLGPGRHDLMVCHPCTGQPVRVCLKLPCKCTKIITEKCPCGGRKVTFKVKGLFNDVVVKFTGDGKVHVKD